MDIQWTITMTTNVFFYFLWHRLLFKYSFIAKKRLICIKRTPKKALKKHCKYSSINNFSKINHTFVKVITFFSALSIVSPPCLVAVNKMTSWGFFYLVIKIKFIKELNVLMYVNVKCKCLIQLGMTVPRLQKNYTISTCTCPAEWNTNKNNLVFIFTSLS